MEKRKWFEFITEYTFKGKKYGSSIYATTEQEAKEILNSKKETEIILGFDPTKPIKV